MGFLFRRVTALTLCALIFFSLLPPLSVHAAEAAEISGQGLVTESGGFDSTRFLFDNNNTTTRASAETAFLTLTHSGGLGSLYIVFAKSSPGYSVTNLDTGEVYHPDHIFLHECVDLQAIFGAAPTSVTVSFDKGSVLIHEIHVYGSGEIPSHVQQWKLPRDGKTDLVLFSTHGDDEHLFFAGVLPYYAAELGYQVQVVYLTDHHNNNKYRIHEMLNGLWAAGVETYPVFGEYPDFFTDNIEDAYSMFQYMGYPRDQMIGFVVEQLRRFKPLVVLGHDFAGEYGHAQHMVYADMLASAVQISQDPDAYPDSALLYGTWDVPKAYFHLYNQNPIVMDWDKPLAAFGGETAFEVSVHRGFREHRSQIWDFAWYYTGYDRAADLPAYNPCYYGLYRSTVGEDIAKNDFFENLTHYAEQDRLAEEAERLRAEEEAQAEAERLRAEEEARKQAEETIHPTAAPTEAPTEPAPDIRTQEQTRLVIMMTTAIVAAIAFASILILLLGPGIYKRLKTARIKKSENF